MRALLNWCAHEGLLSEAAPRRVVMPKREQKVIQPLSVIAYRSRHRDMQQLSHFNGHFHLAVSILCSLVCAM